MKLSPAVPGAVSVLALVLYVACYFHDTEKTLSHSFHSGTVRTPIYAVTRVKAGKKEFNPRYYLYAPLHYLDCRFVRPNYWDSIQ